MLIWTTKGPKRAEKPAPDQPSEDAFAESHAASDGADGPTPKANTSADVFLDDSADKPATKPEAAADADWSSVESPGAKARETAE